MEQTPKTLEQILEAQLGNQVMTMARMQAHIELLQAELAKAKAELEQATKAEIVEE